LIKNHGLAARPAELNDHESADSISSFCALDRSIKSLVIGMQPPCFPTTVVSLFGTNSIKSLATSISSPFQVAETLSMFVCLWLNSPYSLSQKTSEFSFGFMLSDPAGQLATNLITVVRDAAMRSNALLC
jgi:hypothetical protein